MKGFMGFGCFIQAIIIGIYAYISYATVDYITNYFGKDLPWIADMLIGMVSFSLSIWFALVLWLVG